MNYKFILLFIFCITPKLYASDQENDYAEAEIVLQASAETGYPDNFNNDSERSIIDDSPSETSQKNPKLEEFQDNATSHIMSRFVGTFIGFGLGHLMQGRWLSGGWIYTIADLATLPVISDPWPFYGRDENYKKGLGAYLLIKTIQIFDVWSFEETPTKIGLKPVSFFHENSRHYGFALSTTF
ncbi:MAG: hypothetical protein AB8G05_10850 [Oligoflexales bacterium]